MPLELFDQGLVNNRDPSSFLPGELSKARCEYRIGSTHAFKPPGRSQAFDGTGVTGPVIGLHLFEYEDASDQFIISANGNIYESTPGTTLSFGGSVLSGLNTTAKPAFASFSDQWVHVNGQDANKIREPNGTWRNLGMQRALGQTTVTSSSAASTATRPATDSGDFTSGATANSGANARDADNDTYSYGEVSSGDTSDQHTWTWTAAGTTSGHTLFVDHSATGGVSSGGKEPGYFDPPVTGEPPSLPFPDPDDLTENISFTTLIEYSTNAGVGWTELVTLEGPHSRKVSTVALSDGITIANLRVRVTTTYSSGDGGGSTNVFDIRIADGSPTPKDITYGVRYFVTERYIDGDNVSHESLPTKISASITGTGLTKNTIDLPSAAANSFTTQYVIYRSLDTESGGFPFMWEVATAPVGQATWLDDFSLSLTSALDKGHLFDFITVQYPDGVTADIPINSPPPKAKFVISYQGSMVYIPVEVPRRVYYSLPSSISSKGAEQVPGPYYLEFLTSQNDSANTAALTNGGRTLIVFFPSYSMMVNYLPQASDPGRFDTRVKEYVSDKRGSAGRLTATSFSPDDGVTTIAASVDSLGLWITDGVGMIRNWSDDIKWRTPTADGTGIFDGVDLSTACLINNPEMRRLELLFLDDDGSYKEYHFFYGMLKENNQPKITGPWPAKWISKHYANLSGTWRGWSGDSTTGGKVYTEREQDADAANAFDANGSVPFDVETRDMYDNSLQGAAMVVFGYPKFASTPNKDITVTGTFQRDSSPFTDSKAKTFKAGAASYADKNIWWHRYADRHKVRFQDESATAMPELVAYEYTVRPLGPARQ